MLYLNEKHIKKIGIDWVGTIDIINQSVKCLAKEDYSQPIKPYLRFRDLKNRIIAMPAFLGGTFNIAGIKWIASFPDNNQIGLPRAHSVLVLNNFETGEPIAIINTPLLSIIRTVSVSGLIIKYFQKTRKHKKINIGITGFGPIGQYHLKMCSKILGNKISRVFIYDINKISNEKIINNLKDKIVLTKNWEEAYIDSDIFITCTVSNAPYIDICPKKGSLHLNVSLRDYKSDIYNWFKDAIFVDDWVEVCREKTDIEILHKEKGLEKENTFSIIDIIENQCFNRFSKDTPIMFNPMGMAIFDIGIADYYFKKANTLRIGRTI